MLKSKKCREKAGGKKEKGLKIYTNAPGNYLTQYALVSAKLAGVDVEVFMKTNEEWKADKEMVKKN